MKINWVTIGFSIGVLLVPPTLAQCINGQWDLGYNWIKDCTSNNPYDGWYKGATAQKTVSGDTQFTVGSAKHTLSWRLHWFQHSLSDAPAMKDSLPLILGLHSWTDGATIEQLLGAESSLMQYEGGWEDVIFLTVALENGNNLNTWWDGSKVNGIPTTWAMDIIVGVLKSRIKDACQLLSASESTSVLTGKHIDSNRVYLIGTSMGGSGTYHLGIRHPELFAAVHANAGFADYLGGPCGIEAFCTSFTNDFIGTQQENLQMQGLDGKTYPARQYSDMSWFAGVHNGASWTASLGKGRKYEPPYLLMTHGKTDVNVDIGSANRLVEVLKEKKYGYSFLRHTGGHSAQNFARLNWLMGFHRNLSYPALSRNSTDITTGEEHYNYLDKIGWLNTTIVDQANLWQVQLTGQGTVDVTPRHLQQFQVASKQEFHWWLNTETGSGTTVTADSNGVLTIPGVVVNGVTTLILRPTTGVNIRYFQDRRRNGSRVLGKPRSQRRLPALVSEPSIEVDALGVPIGKP
jgi:hypothetical protein